MTFHITDVFLHSVRPFQTTWNYGCRLFLGGELTLKIVQNCRVKVSHKGPLSLYTLRFWNGCPKSFKKCLFPTPLFSKGNVKWTYHFHRSVSKLRHSATGYCGSSLWLPILLQDIHSLIHLLEYTIADKWQNGNVWSLQLFLSSYISPDSFKMVSRWTIWLPSFTPPWDMVGKYRQTVNFDAIYNMAYCFHVKCANMLK